MGSAINRGSFEIKENPPFFLKINKRNDYINHIISQPIEVNRTYPTNFFHTLQVSKVKLNKAKIKNINVIILKIINLFIKIFKKNYVSINVLLETNKKCNLLLKKIEEIKNPNKIKYNESQNLYQKSKLQISDFEKNLYGMQIIQYESLLNHLKTFENTVLSKDKGVALDAYSELPSCLKVSLEKLVQLKTNKSFNKNIDLFKDKTKSEESILSTLQNFYKNQIDNYKHFLKLDCNDSNYNSETKKIKDKIKKEYLFINNLFQKKSKNKDTVYDVSIDRVINEIPHFIFNKPLTVTIVGVEYAGIIKHGGLAEAVEGLSKGLKEQNKEHKIQVIFPKYNPLPPNIENNMGIAISHQTSNQIPYNVYIQEINGIEIHFIDHPAFKLDPTLNIYGPDYPLMAERFATFTQIAADYIYEMKNTDVIHLHDWHVSGIALKLKKEHKNEWKDGKIPPIVFTYHNNSRNSQGRVCMGAYSYDPVILGYQEKGIVKANENLFVKTLKIVDAVTTVSENFAIESQRKEFGHGISFAVKQAAKIGKLTGILNGTDANRWNPEVDEKLKKYKDVETGEIIDLSYGVNSDNLALKRRGAKNQLQKWIKVFFPNIKIDLTKPLVTFIGRYDSFQKGLNKFEEAIKVILENGGQFLCIGTNPDTKASKIISRLQKKYTQGVIIICDEKVPETGKLRYQDGNETMPGVNSLIRASSDFIFIPSSFEPCGLTQFEGWLFGSLAIASNTGGLADSIITYKKNKDEFNGYLFNRNELSKKTSMKSVLKEALVNWQSLNDNAKSDLMKRIMQKAKKNGWSTSPSGLSPVQKYLTVYENAKKRSLLRNQAEKVNEIDLLRYKLHSKTESQNKNVYLEEKYLSKYYSKECDSESLDVYFQKLPQNLRPQVPSPYGRNVNFDYYEKYGSFISTEGTFFNVYAPKAKKIMLVLVDNEGLVTGTHALTQCKNKDWSITLPSIQEGQNYYYLINGNRKIDPYARSFAPFDKSKTKLPLSVVTKSEFSWSDAEWIQEREKSVDNSLPMSIYELHPGYWKKQKGKALNYRELANDLATYCKEMGYTHVELMGILEHPSELSWGYQVTGYFAPTSRYGSIDDFKYMIDFLHKNKIGVILDWVPAHFAKNSFGLKDFDGTKLYDASGVQYSLSIRRHFFKYDSKHFDFKKKQIREFLFSSAMYWLKEMHIDSLRIDCIRSILESEDKSSAHLFLRDLNAVIHANVKGCYTIAEDFSGDRRMTASFGNLGFGFDKKWHAGWMHGVFKYFGKTINNRKKSYQELYNTIQCDNFSKQVMFISHDQVKSVENKNLIHLFSSYENQKDKYSNIKVMLSFMMCLPGKKLIFMGEDSGLHKPWDKYVNTQNAIQDDIDMTSLHTIQIQKMIKTLNQIYRTEKAMHEFDDNGNTLEWIADDKKMIHAYRRKSSNGEACVILHNFIDEERRDFKVSIKSQINKTILVKQIFTTQEDDLGTELPLIDNSYIVNVPPLSTIIIKEEVN